MHKEVNLLPWSTRASMIRPLPVSSNSSQHLRLSWSALDLFCHAVLNSLHLCLVDSHAMLPLNVAAPSKSLRVSINVVSSERPPLTTLSKWSSSAFCFAKMVHSFPTVLISTYNLKLCLFFYCLLLSLKGKNHMARKYVQHTVGQE